MIDDKRLQDNIIREAAKIPSLLSRKFDKCKYVPVKEILTSGQSQIMQRAKFIYYPLKGAFEEQTKTIKNQWKIISWRFTILKNCWTKKSKINRRHVSQRQSKKLNW